MRGKQTHYIFSINISTIIKGSLIFMISLLSVFSIVGLLTALKYEYRLSSNSVNAATEHVKGETLYHLFAMENKLFSAIAPTDSPVPSVSELAFQFATNIRLQDPRSLLGRELPGFSIFDGKILVAGEGTNYTNIPIESQPPKEALDASNDASLTNTDKITEKDDEKKEPPALTTGGKKRVYLYFTHTRESYLPHLKGVTDPDAATHSTLNVTKVGDMLREELEDQGIGTHVDKTDIVDQLQKSGLNYSRSYQQSRAVVAAAQSSQKDLQYFIDIHRDSLRKDVTTATIN
ncbi:MAG TPA: stage II sporulation protein P, partial [Chondromyces sp.]|nr:stage II sporulation protein P [Chondromyces sp.]